MENQRGTTSKHENKWGLDLTGDLPQNTIPNVPNSWETHRDLLPYEGSPGISRLEDSSRSFYLLMWCDEEGIPRGLLQYDKIYHTLNVVRDPECSGKAIGRKLVHHAGLLWGIDLSAQTFTEEGLRMAKSALS